MRRASFERAQQVARGCWWGQVRDLISGRENLERHLHETAEGNWEFLEVRNGHTTLLLESHIVQSVDGVMDMLRQATSMRHTAAHKMNTRSSRSHMIVHLEITLLHVDKTTGNTNQCPGHLYMVDLAGSERLSRTEATGE